MSCLTKVNQRHNSKCNAVFKEELRSSLDPKNSWGKDHSVFLYQHGPQPALCTLLAYPRECRDSSRSDFAMQIRKALQPIPLHPAAPDWASVGKGVQLPMGGWAMELFCLPVFYPVHPHPLACACKHPGQEVAHLPAA